jgi:predicted permease
VASSAGLLLSVFATNILPVFLVAAVGFLLARYTRAEAGGLAKAALYGLAPCLLFDLLVTSTVRGADLGKMALLCLIVTGTMGVVSRGVAAALRLERPARMAFMLVTMFSNGGNYGLPVTLFAFGREALTFATIYFVTSSVLTYTVGVSLAASGRRTIRDALHGVARVPAVYAVLAAGLVLSFDVRVPDPITVSTRLLGDAALPVMILVLGMQLARAQRPERPMVVAAAAALSLLVAPAIAFGAVRVLGLAGPALQAGVIQASMPTAVVTTVLALEFDAEPTFVTSVVIFATLASPFTLTLLIAYLQGIA